MSVRMSVSGNVIMSVTECVNVSVSVSARLLAIARAPPPPI